MKFALTCFVAVIVSCAPADNRSSRAPADEPPPRPAIEPKSLSGTFFGAAPDGRAWLFYIDVDARWGSLEVGPRPLQLCRMGLDSQGVSLNWAPGYGGALYGFKGQLEGNDLVGEFTGSSVDRRPPIQAVLRATRVADPPGPTDVGRGGYYSNVAAPGGELGGIDLVFIDAPQHPVGVLTFYEGSAGEPWAIQELTRTGDTLRFRIHRSGRPDDFQVVLGERGVTLSSSTLEIRDQRLEKRATVLELARTTYVPGCRDSLRIGP